MSIIRDRFMASQAMPRASRPIVMAPQSGGRGITSLNQGRPIRTVPRQRDEEEDPSDALSLVHSYLSKNPTPNLGTGAGVAGAKEPEEDKGNLFQQAAGKVFGNPVAQAILKPLEYADYGRRAVTLGLEEFAEGITGQELEATEGDTRSNWDKLNDPTYGVGQLLGGTLGDITPWQWDDKWVDRAGGFIGDIALDPLTLIGGIGAVARGGSALSKMNRAAQVGELVDKGVDAKKAADFVRKGAGAVDQEVLDLIGAKAPAVRIGPSMSNSVALPGTKTVGRAVSRATGGAGDVLRRTRVGEKVAGLRTPDTLEDAYARLFHNKGPMSFEGAAEKVQIDSAKRAIGQTFRRTEDRTTKDLRKRLGRLDDEVQKELVDSVELGIPMRDPAVQGIRDEYAKVYTDIMNRATGAGLTGRFRRRYSPHILTRDAAKWLRDGGGDTGDVRAASGISASTDDMFTQNLYDPSGVTMARQFQPGQELMVNGQPVKFADGQPPTISQVNEAFRNAGLKFDYFETKPDVILSKYLDMISEDVGRAGSIKSRVGARGGVHQYTDEEKRLLGMDVGPLGDRPSAVIRGQGEAVQPDDIGVLRERYGAELPEGQQEILAPQRATTTEVSTKRDGTPKLTKSGKAKLANGVDIKDMDPEVDYRFDKPRDKTVEYNQKINTQLKTRIDKAREGREAAEGELNTAVQSLADLPKGVINARYNSAVDASRRAKQSLDEVEERLATIGDITEELWDAQGPPTQALQQLDEVIATFQRDIDVMDSFLQKAADRQYSPAIKNVRDRLVARRDELADIIEDAKKMLPDTTAQGPRIQAQLIESIANAPVIEARRLYEQVEESVRELHGLPAKEAEIQQLADRMGFKRADINEIRRTLDERASYTRRSGLEGSQEALDAPTRTQARYESQMRKLLRERDELAKKVDDDRMLQRAKSNLDSAEMRAERMPLGEAEAQLGPRTDPSVPPGETMATKAPNVRGPRRTAGNVQPSDIAASQQGPQFAGRAVGRRGEAPVPVSPEEMARLMDEEKVLAQSAAEADRALAEAETFVKQNPELAAAGMATETTLPPSGLNPQNVTPSRVGGKDVPVTPAAPVDRTATKLGKELSTLRRRMKKEGVPNASQSAKYKPVSAAATRLRNAESQLISQIRQQVVAPLKQEAERAHQLLNQNIAQQTARAGGDVVPTAAESATALARSQGDVGALEAARRTKATSSAKGAQAASTLGEAVPEFQEIDELLKGIINDPELRGTLREEELQELLRPITEGQAPARQLSADVIDASREKAKQYTDQLDAIDEDLTTTLARQDLALSDRTAAVAERQTAKDAVAKAQPVVREYNQKAYANVVDDAGQPVARPLTESIQPDDVDGYTEYLQWYTEDLQDVLSAAGVPEDVITNMTVYYNQAIDSLDDIRKADMDAAHYKRMKSDKNYGRVVEARLDEQWTNQFRHLVGDDIVVSKELAQSFNRVRSAAYDKNFWPFIDTMTGLFKTYATLTPGFHSRNFMSAAFMNSVEGVPMKTQYEGARLMTKYLRSSDPDKWLAGQSEDIRKAFESAFGTGIGGRYSERGIGRRGSARYRLVEGAFDNPVTRWLGQGAGGWIEGSVRLPLALQTIRDGGNVTDAINRVTRNHFDYSQVSRFDEKAKRMIPFWTFMSRNLPLQLTQMYTKPRTYAKYNSFIRNFAGTEEPNTPDYFGDVGAFRFMDVELGGLPVYLQPDLAHTRLTEDIEKLTNITSSPERLLSDFNPLFTAPAEFVFKKNLYTGRDYDDTDVRTAGLPEKPLEWLASVIPGMTEQTPEGQTAVQERFLDLFRSVVPVYDRAVRLAPGAVTGEAAKDANSRQMESWLRFFGAPIRQLSPEQQRAQQRSDRYERLDARAMERALAALDQ